MKWFTCLRVMACGLALQAGIAPTAADWLYTPGAGPSAFVSFNSGTSPAGTGRCAVLNTDCAASVPVNTAGAALFVTGNAGLVNGTGGTFPVTQATAASLNATVIGTGTFATQATLGAETTKVIGTVRTLGNVGAIIDFAGQNAASPANSWLTGCQFNTSPTTITSGNVSPMQCDNAGNHLVKAVQSGMWAQNVAQWNATAVAAPGGNNSDGIAYLTTGVPWLNVTPYCNNGTTLDRCQSVATGVFGSPASTVLSVQNNDPCSYAAKFSAAISITSATTTNLVPVSGSTAVYGCGASFTIAPSATSADTALFEYGTGAACTSPTVLTGTYGNGDLTSAAPVVPINYGAAGSTIFKSPAANGICIVTTGTAVNVQGVLTYVQQ